MDICSARFRIYTDSINPGVAFIRDRNAPYHLHTVALRDVPSEHAFALMTERQFDRRLADLAYS